MRKEKLLKQKNNIINNLPWYIRNQFSDDIIRQFSINQLNTLVAVSKQAEEYRSGIETFHSLSVNDVVHCETGVIIHIDDNGNIQAETEHDILNSASSEIYKNWKQKRHSK